MTTNINMYTGFSLARIGKLLRLSWVVNRKTLFIGISLQIFLLWFLPRAGMILGYDSHEVWVKNFNSDVYIITSILGSILLALFSWLVLLNRQTQHHVPGAYTLLPASMSEKYVSLILQGVFIEATATVMAVSLIALTSLEIPNLWEAFRAMEFHKAFYQEFPIYDTVNDNYKLINTKVFLPFLAPLAGTLCYALASIHFRKMLVALFITSILLFVVLPIIIIDTGLGVSIIINLSVDTYRTIFQCILGAICIGLLATIYYRLKTLQVK